MQKHVNLVDLVKSFPTNIYLQNLVSIQKRTSPVKFAHLAEKSGKGSISNLSPKMRTTDRGALQRHPRAFFHRNGALVPPQKNALRSGCHAPFVSASGGQSCEGFTSFGMHPRKLFPESSKQNRVRAPDLGAEFLKSGA